MKRILLGALFLAGMTLMSSSAHAQLTDPFLIEAPQVPPAVLQAFEADFGWYLDQLDELDIDYTILWFREPQPVPGEGWPLEIGSYTTPMLFDGDKAHHFGVSYNPRGYSIRDDF